MGGYDKGDCRLWTIFTSSSKVRVIKVLFDVLKIFLFILPLATPK